MDAEPLVPLSAPQSPEPVQVVAALELHVRVALPPTYTVVGRAVTLAVGIRLTVTLALLLVPPEPLQVTENTVFAVIDTVACEPLAASAPLQPSAAWQPVASVEDHVSVAESPELTAVLST